MKYIYICIIRRKLSIKNGNDIPIIYVYVHIMQERIFKGDAYDPKLKPKKLNKREREKAAKQKERLFAWVPEKMKVGN